MDFFHRRLRSGPPSRKWLKATRQPHIHNSKIDDEFRSWFWKTKTLRQKCKAKKARQFSEKNAKINTQRGKKS